MWLAGGSSSPSAPGVVATARLLWPGITALHRGGLTKPAGPWFPVAFLAASRPGGSPRLHPFCPILRREAVRGDPPEIPGVMICAGIAAARSMPCPGLRRRGVVSIRARVKEARARPGIGDGGDHLYRGGRHDRVGVEGSALESGIARVDVARWPGVGQRGTWAVRQTWIAPWPGRQRPGSRSISPAAGSWSRFRTVASGPPSRQPACGAPHQGR